MAFDDILQPKRRSSDDFKATPTSAPKSAPSSAATDEIIKNLLGSTDPSEIGRRLGLNEDLTQQVIVPLLAILDKHGSKVVNPESPTLKAAGGVASILTEFGPLFQGAYRYFSGVKTQLNEADAALLEANAAALSASDLNNLFDSEDDLLAEVETVSTEPERPKPQRTTFGPPVGPQMPSAPAAILQSGKVDYYALLGAANPLTTSQGGESDIYATQQTRMEEAQQSRSWKPLAPKNMGLTSVEEMAYENALTPEEINTSDSNRAFAGDDLSDVGMDLTNPQNLERIDDGMDEIRQAMLMEKENRMMESKDPATANPQMSAEDLVAHIKSQARPGAGGQTSSDAHTLRNRGPDIQGLGVQKMRNAFNLPAAQATVKNAFKIDGLAEAMSQERTQREESQKGGDNGAAAASAFQIDGLSDAMSQELQALESDSKTTFGTSTSGWSMGTVEELDAASLGVADYKLSEALESIHEENTSEPRTGQFRRVNRTPPKE